MLLVGTGDGLAELDLDGRVVRRGLPGVEVTGICGDWAIADEQVVSLDDGTPRELPEGLLPRCLLELAGGRVLVGTSEARLVLMTGGTDGPTVDRAFDDIPTRPQWTTPWGGPPDLRSLALGATGPLAGVHVGGVWRRDPDDWTEVVSAEADDHQVVAEDSTVAVAAAVGVGQSADGGDTWHWSADGLHASYCRAAVLADGWLLVSASTGPATRQAAVYRRPLDDPERPFAPCGGESGLPATFPHNIDTFGLAAAGNLVAVGERFGRVYLSEDAGETWRKLAEDLPGVHCLAFAG
ncbi:MAG TPA: hypothetical protein VE575_15185 [Acidimicrobiales bacterium]|nr:hypothetical protein [Acidimicrobiales bacterium]